MVSLRTVETAEYGYPVSSPPYLEAGNQRQWRPGTLRVAPRLPHCPLALVETVRITGVRPCRTVKRRASFGPNTFTDDTGVEYADAGTKSAGLETASYWWESRPFVFQNKLPRLSDSEETNDLPRLCAT